MAGEIDTPLGPIKKEYVYVGGGLLVVIVSVVWYRSRQQANAAAATAAAGANTGIDPATGYPYGSAEDAAALANQGNYINPSQPYTGVGGSSSVGTGTGSGTFTTNAQWAQFVEQFLESSGAVSDVAPLSAAIGKYITGQPVTSDQQSLIEQAIAIGGYPPVSGPDAYPPSIRTSTGTTPPPADAVYRDTKEGQSVQSFLNYYGITYAQMLNLNPGIQNSITRANSHGYVGPNNPPNGTEQDVFGSVVHVRLK